ncbi:MAG: NADH-quinone oxidoreductase subunit M [Pirellulales bacterium]
MKFWLLLLLSLPLVTALVLLALRRALDQSLARKIALAGSAAALVASLMVAYEFQSLPTSGGSASPVHPRFELRHTWLTYAAVSDTSPEMHFDYFLGIDGISLLLIVLTTLLTVASVLISWDSIRDRAAEFYCCLLLLEASLVGVFCAFDVVLFYVLFEFTLIPLFFVIGIWGGPLRQYAAMKFFLYTFTASLVTLVGLVALVLAAAQAGVASPTSIPDLAAWLTANPLSRELQIALMLAISTGFMVKIPLFPFHTWLPLAHVEAPTAGSVLLAGVLLKLGTFGFLRLCLPMFPDACLTVGLPLFATLAVIGIIYGSLCALAQRDIKKLVAYSSIAHLGFCMLGLFALNAEGLSGGVLQMINHGLSTAGLFLLVGMIYDRYHTRQMDDLHGLATRLPLLACAMVFITMASIGLPGLNGFVGEFLSLAGMFQRDAVFAVLGATGVILGAWYMLGMLQTVFFGPLHEPTHGDQRVGDLNGREALAIVPICVLCLWIGVMPQPFLRTIQPDVDAIAALYAQPSRTASADRESSPSQPRANIVARPGSVVP